MARKIAVEIVGDASSIEKAYKRATESTKRFNSDVSRAGKAGSSAFGGLGKIAGAAAGFAGIGGITEAVRGSYEEFAQQQKVAAQTAAVLKSTGDVSGVTAGHVDELASSLSKVSGTQDDVIQSGENMLLTFTNVRNQAGKGNDIYDQSTRTLLDMSTALGEDMPKAAIQLGKALNDPIHGVTALQRVGVTFTADQKKQIAEMVKSGHTMQAQKLILHELNREFGGSAKAAGETLPGKLNILKNTFFNLGATLIKDLSPQITKVANSMIKWLSDTKNQKHIVDLFRGAISALKTGINILRGAFQFLSSVVGGNANAIKVLIGIYAGWKLASLASRIVGVASSFATLGGATAAATVETEAASASLMGPAGIAVAAVAAAAGIAYLINQIPGWTNAMKSFGGTLYDVAAGLGLVSGGGPPQTSQRTASVIRGSAFQLEQKGYTPQQAASILYSQYPSVPHSDIDVFAGAHGRTPTLINVQHMSVVAHDPNGLADALARQNRRRAMVR